jgi:hypothetical protein
VDTVSVREREVRDRNGNWYSMRIRPYKNIDNKIDGAVLALFNVDGPHQRRRSDDTPARHDAGGGGGGNDDGKGDQDGGIGDGD